MNDILNIFSSSDDLDNETSIANSKISIAEYLSVLIPLVLFTIAVELFHIEEGLQLPRLMWIVTAGFIQYPWLPFHLRLPYFFLLNIIALVVLFSFGPGLGALAVGLLLVIVATLPIKYIYRVLLILVISGCLATFKSGIIGGSSLYQMSSIVGGLFMFRLIMYMYEIHHETAAVSFWKRISYFFLLPNLIFWIFPIVDYRAFIQKFYTQTAVENCRKGLQWMFTGLVHLLIYRVIYYYGLPSPKEITGIYSLLQYLILSYALIIRLSGIFHLSAGIICLFGFDLPRTFNNYFLASSFSDLWHRVNSYWREFVMKVFYFPIYFRFKKRNSVAVAITVLLVFAVNWFLHSYQWFWIRGSFLVKHTDILFWGIWGVLLAINSVMLMNRKALKSIYQFTFSRALTKALKILGMFAFMCVMWSIWTSPSIDDWLLLYASAGIVSAGEITVILSVLVLVLSIGVFVQYIQSRQKTVAVNQGSSTRTRMISITVTLAGLCIIGNPSVSDQIGRTLAMDVSPILSTKLNTFDSEQLHKGYYEDLIVSNSITSRMWEVQEEKKKDQSSFQNSWNLNQTGVIVAVESLVEKTLLPNQQIEFKGATFSTNEHGMRDRSYTQLKPDDTYRIVLLGGSGEMGSGVNDDETFENLIEDKLNSLPRWNKHQTIEILNFSRISNFVPHFVGIVDTKIEKFQPDAIMLFLHDVEEIQKSLNALIRIIKKGYGKEYPKLTQLATELNITADSNLKHAIRAAKPRAEELFMWGLEHIENYCKQRGMPLVIVALGTPGEGKRLSEQQIMDKLNMLTDAEYTVWNAYDVYDNYDESTLKVAPWDYHPNNQAHQIVADKLFLLMQQNEHIFSKD